MSRLPVGRLISLALGTLLLAACAAQGVPPQDKAGAQTLVLKLATADTVAITGLAFGQKAFIKDLTSVSGGLIKVDVTLGFDEGAADVRDQACAGDRVRRRGRRLAIHACVRERGNQRP